MKKYDGPQSPTSPSPHALQAPGIDPSVIERHLARALPEHRVRTASRAHRDRYLNLHLHRLIPPASQEPVEGSDSAPMTEILQPTSIRMAS